MKRIELFYSPLGMYSLLRGDYVISVLRKDGTLDKDRLENMVKFAANLGANAMRDFYWIDSQTALETISPFRIDSGRIIFNDTFFRQQRIIAETCQRHGIRYYYVLFDHCGTKGSTGAYNPWRSFDEFFYGIDAAEAWQQYIERLLEAFAGLDVGLDVCNEPKPGAGEFLAEVFLHLEKKKFDLTKVIIGNDYYLKEKVPAYGKDYRTFRDLIAAKLGAARKLGIKTQCISPVHNAIMDRIMHLWGDDVKPGGQRRILYSMDGVRPRPDAITMREIALKVLRTKRTARKQGKVHFEVVLGKQTGDTIDSMGGIAAAYKEVFGSYPKNYGKYPEAKPPQRWSEEPTPPVPPPPPQMSLQQQIDDLRRRVEALEKSNKKP